MKINKVLRMLSCFLCLLHILLVEPFAAPEIKKQKNGERKTKNEQGQQNNKLDSEVKIIVQLLEKCPSWNGQSVTNATVNSEILKLLERISKSPTPIIREAVKNYSGDPEKYQIDYHQRMGPIFLLNRYLFNIPSGRYFLKEHFFGGILGVPHSKGKVDLLWPFSNDSNGNLLLTGYPIGYHNFGYRAVDEFDFLKKMYGIRKHIKSVKPESKSQK